LKAISLINIKYFSDNSVFPGFSEKKITDFYQLQLWFIQQEKLSVSVFFHANLALVIASNVKISV
jgi:hypothetical protein